MGLNGNVLDGKRRPSSEMQMHLLYYGSRHEVRAMCHAHPPTATGFAAAGRALEEAVFPEVLFASATFPWHRNPQYVGTLRRARAAGLQLRCDLAGKSRRCDLWAGSEPRMETSEQFARVMLTAKALGGRHLLPCAEVQKLIAARPRHGASCHGERLEPPVAAESAGERSVLARQGLKAG
jgi:L-fuculose-phosphate aldolase